MTDLYKTKLAAIYDRMYQGFIDYNKEFEFYAAICASHNSKSVLEIACGSGNLARNFSEKFSYYTGFDLSKAMLSLASKKHPQGNFIQGDMRDFHLDPKHDAILITGRSTSYLVSDLDILSTFTSIYKNLNEKGVFIFDFIDAERFIPFIKTNKYITHSSIVDGKEYFRKSIWEKKASRKTKLVDWKAEYYHIDNHKENLLGKDNSTFRCFSQNELKVLLLQAGFHVVDVRDRKTYAFDTYVFTCKKYNNTRHL